MWDKKHYIERQIQHVKGLDKTNLVHEMRRHNQSTDTTAFRLFEYLQEPDTAYSKLFKTKINKVKLAPPLKGFKSNDDRLYKVKHDQGSTIMIPVRQVERALNDYDRSDSIIQQLQLKETTQMMKNIEKLTQQIVKDPEKRMRKRKLLNLNEHKVSKTNRATPECCVLSRSQREHNDSPLAMSISKRFRSLFDDGPTTGLRTVSPNREQSEERVREMLDCYKSYDIQHKRAPSLHLPKIKRPVLL